MHAIDHPACWLGQDLQNSTHWQYRLDAEDILDLEVAISDIKRAGREIISLEKADFPLPHLGPTLVKLRKEILDGRGFVLFKGLPVGRWTREETAIAYWGMGAHLGYAVCQNGKGHLLGHVTDTGDRPTVKESPEGSAGRFLNSNIRGYTSRERSYFHVDFSDIVGLLCLAQAKKGGESLIASSIAIHNEILKTRPDLLELLYQPFWTSRKGEVPAGAKPYYQMPVFNLHEGRLITFIAPGFIRHASQNFPELPRLTDKQIEALDMIDNLASDPRFHLSMVLEPGDIQFINNYTTLHTRTAYEDFPEPERKRHLLRLWLVTPDGGSLHRWLYDYYRAGRRGGIYVPGVKEIASLEPTASVS